MRYSRNKEMKISKGIVVQYVPSIVAVLLLGALGYGGYRYNLLSKDLAGTREALQETKGTLEEVTIDFEGQISGLRESLTRAEGENAELSETLSAEQGKNKMFAEQISGIAGTVGVLQKLSQTDKELLQKYSKVYFLNEHYAPPTLALVPPRHLANSSDEEWVHSKVAPRLETMLDAVSSSVAPLRVVSAYRSFDTQRQVKYGYRVTYGSGANQFSADQGYSEHQLGTTVDLSTLAMSSSLTVQFEKTAEYGWLQANAHRYGFVLSYPKGNAYYQFEPWHWRYVGVALATRLKSEGKYFYDMDQREIDNYLAGFFD